MDEHNVLDYYYSTYIRHDRLKKKNFCLVNQFIDDEYTRIKESINKSPRKNAVINEIKFHEHLALEGTSLKKLIAKQSKYEILVDAFFDTNDFLLLKNDCWLRFRADTWSLKYSVCESIALLYFSCSKFLDFQ
jgi:hypothetical protein